MVSIGDMRTIQYCQNLGSIIDEAKENIPKQCIIGDTCFTSIATIRGNLYTIHARNPTHVQRYSKDLLSMIIILVTDVNGDEIVFIMEII